MDYPRFERIQGHSDNLHLAYHGGRIVVLVLRLVDRWLSKRAHVQPALIDPAIPTTFPSEPSRAL
jgi:hypothetical protein